MKVLRLITSPRRRVARRLNLLFLAALAAGIDVVLCGGVSSNAAWAGIQSGGGVQPATAAEARRLIDLQQFDRLQIKQIYDASETYFNYVAAGGVAAAVKHYEQTLTRVGWKQLDSGVAATEQYADLLFENQGFHIRVSLGQSSEPSECSVMLALLGNVDMRTLPRVADAMDGEHATAINAGHKTNLTIPAAVEELSAKMVGAGWQPTSGFQESPIDVPHYKSLTFRKEACRVMVGVSTDPRNAANPRMVFYIAEPMSPFDFPSWESQGPLQLDSLGQLAACETKWTRAQLVDQLKTWSARFDWKAENAEEYLAEKAPRLVVADGTPSAIHLAIVESGGTTRLLLERSRRVEESAVADAAAEAAEDTAEKMLGELGDAEAPKADQMPDLDIADLGKSIQDQVDAELKKALQGVPGNLNAPGGKSMKELQAQADELMKQLNAEGDDDGDDAEMDDEADDRDTPKLEVVPEDAELKDPADSAIQKTSGMMQLGSKKIQLNHAVAYVRVEDGGPVKCLVFSDQPLKEDVLKQRLAGGESVHGFDLSGFDAAQVEIRFEGDSVYLNFYYDGLSLGTNTGQMKSTVSYVDGLLRGRITLEDYEVRDEKLSFQLQVAQKPLTGKAIDD